MKKHGSRLLFASLPAVAWVAFVVLRPPNAPYLATLEAARLKDEFLIVSGAPYTHLAERPLYSWSAWHGGERTAVKALEVATLPGLIAGCVTSLPVSVLLRSFVTVQQESWVRFAFVLLFSCLQWAALSVPLVALWHRYTRRAV